MGREVAYGGLAFPGTGFPVYKISYGLLFYTIVHLPEMFPL